MPDYGAFEPNLRLFRRAGDEKFAGASRSCAGKMLGQVGEKIGHVLPGRESDVTGDAPGIPERSRGGNGSAAG